MMTNSDFISNVDELVAGGKPFLLWSSPGSDEYMLSEPSRVTVGAFSGKIYTSGIAIPPQKLYPSTTRDEYAHGFESIVASLRARGGKTVYSRVIAGSTCHSLGEVCSDYFSKLPHTFRFVMGSGPQIWIGASPERLIANDPATGHLHTMALAGSRPVTDGNEAWDKKNLEEHMLVRDFIVNTLQQFNLNPECEPLSHTDFGSVRHLRTEIKADAVDNGRLIDLLSCLSPTPALAGYPRKEAMAEIQRAETHSRGLYGGFIAVTHPSGQTDAFVNIRSAVFERCTDGLWHFNIFVGGGLTPLSIEQSEWNETIAKARILCDCLRINN